MQAKEMLKLGFACWRAAANAPAGSSEADIRWLEQYADLVSVQATLLSSAATPDALRRKLFKQFMNSIY